MKKNLTELVFIIDRSGSMAGLETDTIGGFNATIDKHRTGEGEAVVSTVLFDNELLVLHDRIPISEVSPMTEKDYQVRGCTALLDAVGKSIRHTSRIHKYLPSEYRPEHTIVVITTDGYENASRKYTYSQVKEMISGKEAEGWDFLFLGANIDAASEAERIGIPAARAATYIADETGTETMFEALACETAAIRCGSSERTASWKSSIDRDTASRGSKQHSRRGRHH